MNPLADDMAQLHALADWSEQALAALPPRVQRDALHTRRAAAIHARCRSARMDFMRRHGDWLYGTLTQHRTLALRLDEVLHAAAKLVPGLLPSQAQWAQDGACIQSEKEGWEIEQGIVLWGVLRQPECGHHLIESLLRPTARALDLLPEFRSQGHLQIGPIHLQRRDGVAWLTVANQTGLNAEDNALVEAMEVAVDLALLDDQVTVGVVRGGPMQHPKYSGRRVFCSGINLQHLHQGKISFVDFLLRREFTYLNKLRRGLCWPGADALEHSIEKPWVAAVDTFAIGGGLQLLLVFDHVVAERDAYFVLPAAKEGIVPGSANLRLGLRAGQRVSRDMILRGRIIRAEEPDAAGLVDDVVDAGDMDAAIARAVEQMRSEAVAPNRRMLCIAQESHEDFRRYMAEFALVQSSRIYADDVLARLRQRWAA
ncbi:enoyl-CoA hydratase/isomerase family protein [Xanthomonas prunicola]|uniref:(3,5-dihydroxyphenyl)acetyl-CoA 1,2-dioxygenase DpgC n=1 Tax=Xanthomonas prunicola TaxID=2053930 RepID=UPI0021B25BB9|nr:(3,5-dihydroxyphenyl)acetyl-CoA 1,2-dioxygenase DpgC [Xanthomonas prunicola]UXA53240.1 enoyl-CoA hydratase/isomerase family protein [Xanthomonas prunicola]